MSLLALFSCRETQYNYDCGLAPSTPTDLTITNNTNRELDIVMSVKENGLNKFKQLAISPDESTKFCIEYEGPITDGIYIDFENQTTIIKLKHQQSNEFTLKERILK